MFWLMSHLKHSETKDQWLRKERTCARARVPQSVRSARCLLFNQSNISMLTGGTGGVPCALRGSIEIFGPRAGYNELAALVQDMQATYSGRIDVFRGAKVQTMSNPGFRSDSHERTVHAARSRVCDAESCSQQIE